MPIRDFIVSELDKLNSLYEMYEDLNKKSNHKYNYRVRDLAEHIQILYSILDNVSLHEDWAKCYDEDSRDI